MMTAQSSQLFLLFVVFAACRVLTVVVSARVVFLLERADGA